MKPSVFVVLLALLIPTVLTGCTTVTPLPDRLSDCATNLAAGELERLAPKVADVLRNDGEGFDWRVELTELVAQHGIEAVRCVVAAVVDECQAQLAARSVGTAVSKVWQERNGLAVERGRTWLEETTGYSNP